MTPALRRTFLGPLLGAALALTTSAARADRFEYLTYAPPPGWTAREAQDGKLYLRNGTDREGIITFHASRPASGTASQEFAATWRALVAPIAPGPPPEPRLQPDGDYTAAMGARQAPAACNR